MEEDERVSQKEDRAAELVVGILDVAALHGQGSPGVVRLLGQASFRHGVTNFKRAGACTDDQREGDELPAGELADAGRIVTDVIVQSGNMMRRTSESYSAACTPAHLYMEMGSLPPLPRSGHSKSYVKPFSLSIHAITWKVGDRIPSFIKLIVGIFNNDGTTKRD
jgi:hypothetical protein